MGWEGGREGRGIEVENSLQVGLHEQVTRVHTHRR